MKFLITLSLAFLGFNSIGQVCNIFVDPLTATICPGDSVFIQGLASITGVQSFDFNNSSLPSGWAITGGATFTSPCGQSPDNTPYYWASTSGSTPSITTASYDVSCGGFIEFEMVYSVQSGGIPCEGPDEADEGVSLQYSTDGGVTWIDIVYYSPGGYELPTNPNTSNVVATTAGTAYTSWNQFSVPVPLGAMTPGTMFRWVQEQSSSSSNDNWGIDNVFINAGPCNSATINWSNGYIDTTSFYAVPVTDTFYVAYVYDTLGNFQCQSDSIFITLNQASLTYDLIDSVFAYCPTDEILVEIQNQANAVGPYSYNWSNGSDSSSALLGTNGEKKDTIVYYVDITDGCGFVYQDSVVMIVNQTLEIQQTFSIPASACLPNGAVSAIVVGDSTIGTNQPFYNWSGPGQPGTISWDGTATNQILPSGWYYFEVTDDFCTEYDSAFVDMTNSPVANLSGSPLSGCGPLNVTFTNTSENSNNYTWNIAGNEFTTTDLSPQTGTFNTSDVVMLIAADDSNGCADTTYVTVTVEPCGCMDPNALNYNPLATIDNGDCQYATPTVVVPNVFTPNGDNANNLFELTTSGATKIELTILNRWGNVMYQNEGPNPVWDGKTPSGADAEEGTYFYKYKVYGVTEGEPPLEGHGFLQLIRD